MEKIWTIISILLFAIITISSALLAWAFRKERKVTRVEKWLKVKFQKA